ncbi:MAG: flagellar filament capping protein FliD [Pseudomonadota bacterium]|nr:flagellar filament capping protein FliD [Pseudomonadota bacterium]
MTYTSATPTISSAGIGSGLNVDAIVTSLLAIEKRPLTRLQTAATTMQSKLSTFGQIQSLVSGLHDAAAPLFAATSFTLTSATSSDPGSVSAGTSGTATPGLYSVGVGAQASTQTVVSASGQFVDATSVVGTGSLTITLGAYGAPDPSLPPTFTAKAAATPVTITIGPSDNTLGGIRDKINAANAGVTASIVTDSSGSRLSLQSSATGAVNGFQVSVADSDGNNVDNLGLSRLAYDGTSPWGTQLTRTQTSADAVAYINGIRVTSTTNSVSGAVDGVTFNLAKVGAVDPTGLPAPVTINVSRNTDAIKNSLKNFISSYNTLHGYLVQQTKYDAATKTAALLQGDSIAVSVENQMASMLSQPSTASTVFGTFSSLGVQLQKDGSLVLNESVASAALTNLSEVSKALSTSSTTPGANGLAQRISKWTGDLLAFSGTLPGKTKAIQSNIAKNQKDQDAFGDRLKLIEQRLRAQYTALDSTMSKANALAKFVTQQFSTNNNNNNNN